MSPDPLDAFSPPAAAWFRSAFPAPTSAQSGAWEVISRGEDALIVAPTGSGKTLAAFLWALDQCAQLPAESGRTTRVLYVSPLKALAVDVERNLRSPLSGMLRQAQAMGLPEPQVSVAVRSGDTDQATRQAMLRRPPDVLITTPESLYLMLTSRARTTLRSVHTVILDEVHAVAGTKRGAHLAVSLARLESLVAARPQRIGLSATVSPVAEVARFLSGSHPVTIVCPPSPKAWDLAVVVPVQDMSDLRSEQPEDGGGSRSIWPHVEERIVDLICQHRSTIVFANSRRLAERLTARLNEIWIARSIPEGARPAPDQVGPHPPAQVMAQAGASAGAPAVLARAHHGSVSREQRRMIEEDLKAGRLAAVVATSSMELGIDMGAVDLVIQVEAPPSVASGLQRVGRAGHQVGAVSRGVFFPKFRADLLSSAVVTASMRDGQIEDVHVPSNPLDVAAQQIVAAVSMDDWDCSALLGLLRSTAPFAALPLSAYESVLDMLTGRYPSDAFAELRPRLIWDRDSGVLRARPGAHRLAVTSGGTIPDRGLFGVFLIGEGASRVGELDEEMVYESRVGDVFALGSTSWRITEITHDRVLVQPAPGVPGRLPFWHGDSIGRPAQLGGRIGAFARRLAALPAQEAAAELRDIGLDEHATGNLMSFLREQLQATGHIPSDRTIVVESSRDELGDWRVLIHSPWGARVHAPWALLLAHRLQERFGVDAKVMHSDDGIVARLPDTETFDSLAGLSDVIIIPPEEVPSAVAAQVATSTLFAARFRECAARALLLPRRDPARRSPLWQQRQRAAQLLSVAAEHPTFPIVLETVRECLQDVYDLKALTELMSRIQDRSIQVVEVQTQVSSPYALSLLFGYVATFMYEGDSPLAERRAQALSLDPTLLRELLGQAELRELLDPQAIEAVEQALQRLDPAHRPRGIEQVMDLLWALGPITAEAAELRGVDSALLAELESARRAFRTRVAGREVWLAVEDAGRVRDGLGAALPPGLPDAFLAPVTDPIGDLVSRYARSHGPFTSQEVADHLGCGASVVTEALATLARRGRVESGAFRPQGAGTEWCATEVLRTIRRKSIASLRHMAEPVTADRLAPFLLHWQHGAGGDRLRGEAGLLLVIEQLAGLALPLPDLERWILPQRLVEYRTEMLDSLTTAGSVTWSGAGQPTSGDGWVALCPIETAHLLLPAPAEIDLGEIHQEFVDVLSGGAAYFAHTLFHRIRDRHPEASNEQLTTCLWDLVWAGWVCNDTLQPLRSRASPHRPGRRPPPSRPRQRLRHSGMSQARGLAPNAPASDTRLPGRWSLTVAREADATRRAAASAQVLAERYGIVTRGVVQGESIPGGFAGLHRVLSTMDESGALIRSYAVEGLGAAQFTLPGVVDRLRRADGEQSGLEDRTTVMLAATDPANPYGTILPWPGREEQDSIGSRPARRAGSQVVLGDGRLLAYVERGGASLLTWDPAELHDRPGRGADPSPMETTARALCQAVRAGRLDELTVRRIDGLPVLQLAPDTRASRLVTAMQDCGFHLTPSGLRIRGSR